MEKKQRVKSFKMAEKSRFFKKLFGSKKKQKQPLDKEIKSKRILRSTAKRKMNTLWWPQMAKISKPENSTNLK